MEEEAVPVFVVIILRLHYLVDSLGLLFLERAYKKLLVDLSSAEVAIVCILILHVWVSGFLVQLVYFIWLTS